LWLCRTHYTITLQDVSLLPTLPDIARVQTIKILGVAISDRLSVNQHVTNVITSCAQTFHALRILRSQGLNKGALEGVFKAVVIAKLTYASPACMVGVHHGPWPPENGVCHKTWSAFRLLHHQPAPLAELVAEANETLFKNILRIKQHVLHQLLPDRTYNLRSRKHECSLTVKHSVTANEFITRMLYKYMY